MAHLQVNSNHELESWTLLDKEVPAPREKIANFSDESTDDEEDEKLVPFYLNNMLSIHFNFENFYSIQM